MHAAASPSYTMTQGSIIEPPQLQLYATTMETVQVEDESSVPEIMEENTSPAMEASTGEDAAEEKPETCQELPVADTETEVDSAALAEEKEEEKEEIYAIDVVEEPAVAPEEKLDTPQDCLGSEVDVSNAENIAEAAIVEPLVSPVADEVMEEKRSTQQVKVEVKPVTQSLQTERLSDSAGTTPLILTLPIDSLHCIASFLAPVEWASFGRSGKGASRVCRQIFRRVRMHGFRCATEVVTAWVSQSSKQQHIPSRMF
jgi:hypothetical protein